MLSLLHAGALGCRDQVGLRRTIRIVLGHDHRIIDGADAEKFLAYIKEHLEDAQFAI